MGLGVRRTIISPGTKACEYRRKGNEEMTTFSNDADILKCEPALFGDLHPAGQVLASGTGGTLSGTTFTASGASFVNAQVCAGGVAYLKSNDLTVDGAYEIVSVDSATQLTISVIRAGGDDEATAPPAGTDIEYRISTFAPQASEVGFQLMQYFGIDTGNPGSEIAVENIVDATGLKQATRYGVIAAVYAMMASNEEDEGFWKKSLYYQKRFEKARERCRLGIDTSGDGVADVTRLGAAVRLVRD